jgi:S-formylglutathione hydrolase FrmB
MALLMCNFRSEVLELSTSMTVLIPEAPVPPEGYPTLYLLHGLSDDDTMWIRQTAIERYASEKGLAVLMPQVHRSYYANEVHGGAYWTFLTEELPLLASRLFRLSESRATTFVAGLSMGGYGAVKWALQEPDRFSAVASLSGALGIAQRTSRAEGRLEARLWDRIFASVDVTGGPDDLLWMLARPELRASKLPAFYIACGTEDPLLPENLSFMDAAERAGVRMTRTVDSGEHTWEYWDRHIEEVIKWLPLPPSRVPHPESPARASARPPIASQPERLASSG